MKKESLAAWRAVAPQAIAGLVARLALVAWTTPLELSQTESRFWDLATSRLAATAFLPPLYPFFLALVRALVGDDLTSVRVVGACLSIPSIAMVHRLAERHLGPGEGRLPAWCAALMPSLVYYDGRLRSESLGVLLLLLFALLWTAPASGGSRGVRLTVAAGGVLGLLALLRPEFLLLPVLLAVVGLVRRAGQGGLRRAALLLPGMLLFVGPWTLRNERVLGTWALVSSNAGYNLWKSFTPWSDGSQVPIENYTAWDGVPEARYDALGFELGWAYIREHPVRSLILAPAKLAHLFGPERDFLSDTRRGRFPSRSRLVDLGFGVTQNLAWILLLGGGLFALLGPSRTPVKDVALSVLLNLALVHLVFFGDDRFHVPLVPFLCIVLPEAWEGRLRSPRAVRALALASGALGVVWIYDLARDLDRLATLFGP